MTSSYYIRQHTNSPSASIYIRVSEGRYKQYRFATNYDLKQASSWNKNAQCVRTNSIEPFEIILYDQNHNILHVCKMNTWFLILNIATPVVWKRNSNKIVQQVSERATCYTILPQYDITQTTSYRQNF